MAKKKKGQLFGKPRGEVIKHPGRFKGKTKADLMAIKSRLHKKAENEKLTPSERSLLSAANLGVRFKGGEFKHPKKSERLTPSERELVGVGSRRKKK